MMKETLKSRKRIACSDIIGTQNTKKKVLENNFPCHIILKTVNIQNKVRVLKAAREKDPVTY